MTDFAKRVTEISVSGSVKITDGYVFGLIYYDSEIIDTHEYREHLHIEKISSNFDDLCQSACNGEAAEINYPILDRKISDREWVTVRPIYVI